jgi:predicted nucleic acid-binding protein
VIVVDTSVWINAFRNEKSSEARHLSELLDDDEVAIAIPIRIELLFRRLPLGSVVVEPDAIRFARCFPNEATWRRIEGWLGTIKNAGDRFGVGDLLIAAIAAENHARIWSLDGDFARMAKLKLVELYRL